MEYRVTVMLRMNSIMFKGKPAETLGRKATGLRISIHDSRVTANIEVPWQAYRRLQWDGLISVTYQFSDLYWNHFALMIHGSSNSYPLHYLSIDGPHRGSDDGDHTYTIHLVHDRTKQTVCSFQVSATDTPHYLELQKAVINAKLSAVK